VLKPFALMSWGITILPVPKQPCACMCVCDATSPQALSRVLVDAVAAEMEDRSAPSAPFEPLLSNVKETDAVVTGSSRLSYSQRVECALLGDIFGAFHTTSGALSGEVSGLALSL
jgi:hypothetical protein